MELRPDQSAAAFFSDTRSTSYTQSAPGNQATAGNQPGPIKAGVVGYGMSARVMHLPFLIQSPSYEVVSILERHKEDSREKYPHTRLVRTIEELTEDPAISLIVITTPNESHFPYTKKALLAGKHVVVEKPFTINSSEAKELIDLAHQTGKVLSVYQNRRYVSDFRTVRQILDKGLLGEPVEYEAHYDRYRPALRPNAWRETDIPGSGIFYDLGAHLIDQAMVLFGLPRAVTASLYRQRPGVQADDYFNCWLDYGRLKVTVKGGMLVREAGPRYAVHGTLGSYLKYGDDPQEALLKEGVLPGGPGWGEESPDLWGLLHTEIDGKIIREPYPTLPGNYGLYYENLAKTLLHGAPLQERPEQSHNVIRIIELALESHRLNKTIECGGLIKIPSQTP